MVLRGKHRQTPAAQPRRSVGRVMVRNVLFIRCTLDTGRQGRSKSLDRKEDEIMLWTIAVVLVVLWALGFVAFHVTTGFIHLLLLVALAVIVLQLVSGRRTV